MKQLYSIMGIAAHCKHEINNSVLPKPLEDQLTATFGLLIWRNALRHLDGLPCKASAVACYLLSQGQVIDSEVD